jgi:predicted ATP-binding protein involved in virulence
MRKNENGKLYESDIKDFINECDKINDMSRRIIKIESTVY